MDRWEEAEARWMAVGVGWICVVAVACEEEDGEGQAASTIAYMRLICRIRQGGVVSVVEFMIGCYSSNIVLFPNGIPFEKGGFGQKNKNSDRISACCEQRAKVLFVLFMPKRYRATKILSSDTYASLSSCRKICLSMNTRRSKPNFTPTRAVNLSFSQILISPS